MPDVEEMVRRAKLLSSPVRVSIWCCLGEMGMYPLDIATTFGLSPAVVSYHLAILHEAGLVEFTRQGRHRLYVWSGQRMTIVTEAELREATAP